jgi:hypothetical protein
MDDDLALCYELFLFIDKIMNGKLLTPFPTL